MQAKKKWFDKQIKQAATSTWQTNKTDSHKQIMPIVTLEIGVCGT